MGETTYFVYSAMGDTTYLVCFPGVGFVRPSAVLARRLRALPLAWALRRGAAHCELRGKVGDGVNQAADLISATVSIPSLNFIPLTTFGNWF
jgi:hypothetical protein